MAQRMCQLSIQIPSITLIPSVEVDKWPVQYEHSDTIYVSKRVLLAQIYFSRINIVKNISYIRFQTIKRNVIFLKHSM